jgi:hypothetical protein
VDFTVRSADEARREQAASRETMEPGWKTSTIREAVETDSRKKRRMIVLDHLVQLPDGSVREQRDWVLDAKEVAEKFRSAVVAVNVDPGQGKISAADFAGKTVQILVGIEKRRGQPNRNVVEMYRAAPSSVVRG